jgi:hypothetical protein
MNTDATSNSVISIDPINNLFIIAVPEAEKYEESLIRIRFGSDLVRKKIL